MPGIPSLGFITLLATVIAVYVAFSTRLPFAARIVAGLVAFVVTATLLALAKAVISLMVITGLIALAAALGAWIAGHGDNQHAPVKKQFD